MSKVQKIAGSEILGIEDQPVSKIEWLQASTPQPNPWNPNKVFRPEMRLLKRSILINGWCFPLVLSADGIIVDGFHRCSLANNDEQVRAMTGGMVPVVRIMETKGSGLRAATVRFNRARGQHGILAMGAIVRSMIEEGLTEEKVCAELGMEGEEVRRLADERPSPERSGQDFFGKGWEPTR